jgi:transposase
MTRPYKKRTGNTPKGGRPTKFKPEYIEQMIEFFSIDPERKELMETVEEYGSDGQIRKKGEKWKYVPNRLPTILKFAKSIGVPYVTVYRWAEQGEDEELEKTIKDGEVISVEKQKLREDLKRFRNAYNTAKALQKDFLLQIGLSGSAPPASFIFTAKNLTDMRDKVEQEHTHRVVKPLLDNLVLENDDPSLIEGPKP